MCVGTAWRDDHTEKWRVREYSRRGSADYKYIVYKHDGDRRYSRVQYGRVRQGDMTIPDNFPGAPKAETMWACMSPTVLLSGDKIRKTRDVPDHCCAHGLHCERLCAV